MKTLILSAALLSMLAATPAMAETSLKDTVKSEIAAKRTELQTAQAQIKAIVDRDKDEASTSRKEIKDIKIGFRSDVAKMRADVAGKVFNDTLARLEKLTTRIESRIAKIDAAGGDTTSAKAFVASAKANVAQAQAEIATMQSVVATLGSTTSTTTAMANFNTIKADAKTTQGFLTQAKQNLQKAVNALAKFEQEHEKTATTTTQAETQ